MHMKRLFAILQLCLAFSMILWVFAAPFTTEHFNTHSSLLLYQTATGKGHRFVPAEKLARHAERFAQLEAARQQSIMAAYERLEKRAQRPFSSKLADSFAALLLDLPVFIQAWIFLSVVISIMLLLGIEGAINAIWLLPVIILCYAVDNQVHGVIPPPSPDALRLPSEHYLMSRYKGPSLKDAWELYLITEWASKVPESDPEAFRLQIEAGEHALTVARVEDLMKSQSLNRMTSSGTKKPLFFLCGLVVWNLVVAIAAQKRTKPSKAVKC